MARSGTQSIKSNLWAWPVGILIGLAIGIPVFGAKGGVAFGVALGVAFAIALGATGAGPTVTPLAGRRGECQLYGRGSGQHLD